MSNKKINTSQPAKDPETEIHSNHWNEMTVSELYQQLNILVNRQTTATNVHNIQMMKQLQKGINILQTLIIQKNTHTVIY